MAKNRWWMRLQGNDGDEVWGAEAKMRLRNIDTQLLRILEEMTAGRQDAVSDSAQ